MNILFKKIEIPKLAKKIIFYVLLLGFGLCFIYFLVIPFFPLLLFPCTKCSILDGVCAWIKYLGIPLFVLIGVIFWMLTNQSSSEKNISKRIKMIIFLILLFFSLLLLLIFMLFRLDSFLFASCCL